MALVYDYIRGGKNEVKFKSITFPLDYNNGVILQAKDGFLELRNEDDNGYKPLKASAVYVDNIKSKETNGDLGLYTDGTGNIGCYPNNEFLIYSKSGYNLDAILKTTASDKYCVLNFKRSNTSHGYVGSAGITDLSISLVNSTTGDRFQLHDSDGARIYSDNSFFGKTGDHTIKTLVTNANLIIEPNGTGEVKIKSHLNVNNGDHTYINIKGDVEASAILRSTDNTIRGIIRHTVSTANYLQIVNYVNNPSWHASIQLHDDGTVNIYSANSNPIGLSTSKTYCMVYGKSTSSNGILRLWDTETDYVSGRGAIIDCIGYYNTDATTNFARIYGVKANSTQGDSKGLFKVQINNGSTGMFDAITVNDAGLLNIVNNGLSIQSNTVLGSDRKGYFTSHTKVENTSGSTFFDIVTDSSGQAAIATFMVSTSQKGYVGLTSANDIRLHSNDSSEYISIKSTGNILTYTNNLIIGKTSSPTIMPNATNTNLQLSGNGTGIVFATSDLQNDGQNNKWLIARSSSSISGEGGLKFNQGSIYGFRLYTTGTGSSTGSLNIAYVKESDASLQNGSVNYNGVSVLNLNPSTNNPQFYFRLNNATKGYLLYDNANNIMKLAGSATNAGVEISANGTGIVKLTTGSSGYVKTDYSYYVGSNKVVGSRATGWSAATGTATRSTFATSTVSTTHLAERVKALIDDLMSHGLIGT